MQKGIQFDQHCFSLILSAPSRYSSYKPLCLYKALIKPLTQMYTAISQGKITDSHFWIF